MTARGASGWVLGAGMILVGALGLGGCAGEPADSGQTAELEAELQEKTEELRRARERYDQQLTEFTATVRKRHAQEIETLETRLKEETESYIRTIRSLQSRLEASEKARAQIADYRKNVRPPPIPAPATEPPKPRITTRTATPTPATFSIVVEDVTGEEAVIGSHPSTRLVETEEEYRDSFGEMQKVKRRESYEIPEYGYRASARLQNPTEATVEVTLRCGEGEMVLNLGAGEARSVTLDAARGAPLVVRVNNRVRSFAVSYP